MTTPIKRDLRRLREGACFKIEVTGHYLSVRYEDGQLVGVRHRGDRVTVGPSEKDEEFVEQMMGWKGYEEVPRDQPPFHVERDGPEGEDSEEPVQQELVA